MRNPLGMEILLVVTILAVLTEYGSSFNPAGQWYSNKLKGTRECRTKSMTLVHMFVNESSAVTTVAGATSNQEKISTILTPTKLTDRNEKMFQVNSAVKIITPNIKAHHVSSKGFGSFSEESTAFVPAPENAERKDRCLRLPIGLIGKIILIYDSVDSDSSLPLQVKFTPGQSGAYDVPVAFTIHLDTCEVEVISEN